jgi:hypothetical protein
LAAAQPGGDPANFIDPMGLEKEETDLAGARRDDAGYKPLPRRRFFEQLLQIDRLGPGP